MKYNIFERIYKKEENSWTENLIKVLSHTNVAVVKDFLKAMGMKVRIKKMKEINFKMQESGEESIPDAIIHSLNNDFILAIEVKKYEDLNENQIKNHIEFVRNTNYKEKCLLVITNHYSKPSMICNLAKKYFNIVNLTHLSWRQINEFTEKQESAQKSDKNKYLLSQFKEFIESEAIPKTIWGGLSKSFVEDWRNNYILHKEVRKLVEHEVAPYLDNRLKGIDGTFAQCYEKIGDIYCTWDIRASGRQYIHVAVGFETEDEHLSNPMFYVECWWSRRLKHKLEKRKKYPKVLSYLKSHFIFEKSERQFWKEFEIRRILKYNRDRQLTLLNDFIEDCLKLIENSGFIDIAKK